MNNAHLLGRIAETTACWLLRVKGYRIIERNIRTPMGEIDIIARRRSLLIIAEVKARSTRHLEGEVLTTAQQHRISRSAQYFLARHPHYNHCTIRFDLFHFQHSLLPRHITHAWDVNNH